MLYMEYQNGRMSVPSSELGPPHILRKRVCPPPPLDAHWWEEQHTRAGEGVGGPNSDDWKESLALCILCASPIIHYVYVLFDSLSLCSLSLAASDLNYIFSLHVSVAQI